jgi:hypothetical protein
MTTRLEPCNNLGMRNLRVLVLIFLTAGLAMPGQAVAQDASQQATAQALFDEGLRLFGESQFAESCAKFEASLELVPAMGTRGKLAECYEKVGRTASAWAAYREVAVLARRAGQPRREEVAAERAARLEASLSYLTITVSADAQLDELQITRKGVLLSSGVYGTAIATDPGPQSIAVSAKGYRPQTLTHEVVDGERSSIEIPVLEALPASETSAPEVIQPTKMQPQSNVRKIAGISTAAAGGGVLILSAVLGLTAKSNYDAVFDDGLCDSNNQCTPAGVTEVDDARSLANIGTVLAISGVALIGAGTYLWLSSPSSSEMQSQAVRLTPTATHQNLGFSLSGRF